MEANMLERYLSDRQLGERYNVHHLTPRRWVNEDPTFPEPVKLSPGCARWRLSEIEAWEAAKAAPAKKL
jgi:predicted DNA-binding transcriptional regulator AlpA